MLAIDQPTEIGRREESDPVQPLPFCTKLADNKQRWVIADLDARRLPRKVALVVPLDARRVTVTNIHPTNRDFLLPDGSVLAPGQSVDVEAAGTIAFPEGFALQLTLTGPVTHAVGDSTVAFGSPDDPWNQAMQSILGGPAETIVPSHSGQAEEPLRTLTDYTGGARVSSHLDVATVLRWIEQAIAALQCPVSSPSYFSGVAQTVARIINMDRAEVALWDGNRWDLSESRRYIKPGLPYETDPPSEHLLQRALSSKRLVMYPDSAASDDPISTSLMDVHTAIASPILDVLDDGQQILGVLYASRRHHGSDERPTTILDPEQKLVAILSTAIASSIARMKREGLVTKYQQFFSPKVTEAIGQNPTLLEGEDAEVSVLFCDIRGFSKASDVIGPKAAMAWIRDTLSDLSAIVLESDGVLVDYVGDEMFAMWGAPEKTFEHAFRAAMAAQSMMRLRGPLSERYADILPSKVDFGIGICTGTARVGNTGSRQKFKYGPMGRTVNLGSRIQGLTKQWNVSTLMDATTAARLPQDLPIRRVCLAQVVGLDGVTQLYELMSDETADARLIQRYQEALEVYESGANLREAARAFGELVQQYPSDGPSMMMLVRSVNALVHPSKEFDPVWSAVSK